jgi:toprim domain protein
MLMDMHDTGIPFGQKIIIVEGVTDKERIRQVLREKVYVYCTHGTLSYDTIEEDIVPLQNEDVYILVDADAPGNKLRNQLRQELPNAKHLYTRKMYREVACTPTPHLVKIFHEAHFEVDERYLQNTEYGLEDW